MIIQQYVRIILLFDHFDYTVQIYRIMKSRGHYQKNEFIKKIKVTSDGYTS